MGKYTLHPDENVRMSLDEWSKEKCCNRQCETIDLITDLIAGYKAVQGPIWNKCLFQKWSLGDCVGGCHNEIYADTQQRRHGHQTQLSRNAVSEAASILEEKNKESESQDPEKVQWFNDFDELLESVRADIKGVYGIDDLTVYDTALRIGWNQNPRLVPQKYVYLHQGAMKGAVALQRVSRLLKRPYFTFEGKLEYKVEISYFRKDLRELGANFLEDFLCVFHDILRYWADGLEKDLKEKEEKDRKELEKKSNQK